MKFRHVRTVAAAGVVLVALTGARHSHGGGCGSSHSGSSGGSSTSGGYEASTGGSGSTSGGYDGGTSTGGSSTSGSTSGGSTSGYTTGGTGSSRSAMGDIKINGCRYNGAGSVKTTVSATNSSSSTKYTYLLTVKFTAPGGRDLGTRHPSIPYVLPGRTDSTDVIQYVPSDAATSGTYRCSVTDVQRTPLS
ncbi:hypothetical protein ACH4FX_01430 [Streptomyces sp. NPDC018019]|uniref:hypothetical protein n=1 Tax=Streptomyces sp. NPDC018019 TaxID=3365030 RepID=UPI0037903883